MRINWMIYGWRRDEEDGIDNEYKKKRNGIIHNDDNY